MIEQLGWIIYPNQAGNFRLLVKKAVNPIIVVSTTGVGASPNIKF
jgi:hypothetical protein